MEEVCDKEDCQEFSKVFEVAGCRLQLNYENRCGEKLI